MVFPAPNNGRKGQHPFDCEMAFMRLLCGLPQDTVQDVSNTFLDDNRCHSTTQHRVFKIVWKEPMLPNGHYRMEVGISAGHKVQNILS